MPPRWRSRFAFFDAYGLQSSSPQAREVYKALPFGARLRLSSNPMAFLFGPLYFLAKGMWRKGITLLAVAGAVAVVTVVIDMPDSLARAIGLGFAGLAMTVANYAYYLHVAKHSQSWNFLEGFTRRTKHE
ncbi:DUF2628 domain-containing protein [Mycobacterium avium subsp. hominissuis]|nr:DUF2628 domain-containing protein [Mycobacterium avium subsp. hominissuis]